MRTEFCSKINTVQYNSPKLSPPAGGGYPRRLTSQSSTRSRPSILMRARPSSRTLTARSGPRRCSQAVLLWLPSNWCSVCLRPGQRPEQRLTSPQVTTHHPSSCPALIEFPLLAPCCSPPPAQPLSNRPACRCMCIFLPPSPPFHPHSVTAQGDCRRSPPGRRAVAASLLVSRRHRDRPNSRGIGPAKTLPLPYVTTAFALC